MTDEIWDPRGDARRALATAVDEDGVAVLTDPGRLDNLLRDLLPDSPREAALVVAAAQLNVARLLRDRTAAGVDPSTAVRLSAATLGQGRPFEPSACKWVAREFALALGMDVPTEPLPVIDPAERTVSPTGWSLPAVGHAAPEPAPAAGAPPNPGNGLGADRTAQFPPAEGAINGTASVAPTAWLATASPDTAPAGAWTARPPGAGYATPPAAAGHATPPPAGGYAPPAATGYAFPPPVGDHPAPPDERRSRRGVVAAVVAVAVLLVAGGAAALLSQRHPGRHSATSTSATTAAATTSVGLGSSTTGAVPDSTAPVTTPSTTRATTTTTPPAVPPGVNELAGFLAQSARARSDVGAGTVGVEGCKEDPATAINQLNAAIALRQGVLGNLSTVDLTGVGSGAALIRDLRSAMNSSVSADQSFVKWLNDVKAADQKQAQGTQGPQPCSQYTTNPHWIAGNNESTLANNAKMSFVAEWNPVATRYHLVTYQPDGF